MLTTLLAILLALQPVQQQTLPEPLQEKLQEYLGAVDMQPLAEACAETDLIISSVQDSVLRSAVAVECYRHFRSSKQMIADNIAVYLYDRWFASFEALFPDIDDMDEAKFHAFINRGSLVGGKAETLRMPAIGGKAGNSGRKIARPDSLSFPIEGRRNIIYFYSADCPVCRLTSHKLSELLKNYRGRHRLEFISVYTGDNDSLWRSYVSEELSVRERPRVKVHHLRGGDAPFVVPYGVIGTPRLFLVDEKGRILGRRLDVPALKKLLEL